MVVPQIKDTIIPTGATSEIIYKVSDYFNISGPGKYGIKVKIFHPLLKETYESNETGFTITKGQVFWETVVGVPDFEDNGLDPERKRKMVKTRTYRILTSSIGKANVYTLKVEDKERVYQLKRIGFDLGVNLAPKCEIDYLSRLHIIVAASPHVFIYYQFDTNGKMISREVRMKSDSSPKLFVDTKTGVVTIYGGRFAVPEDNDEIQSLPFLQDYNKSAPKDFTIPQMDSGTKAE